MPYGSGLSAGDRYRLEVTRGSVVKSMFKLKKKSAAFVSIIDSAGNEVWKRGVASVAEARALVDLITTQVFSAPLEDFEHWLRTEGAAAQQA